MNKKQKALSKKVVAKQAPYAKQMRVEKESSYLTWLLLIICTTGISFLPVLKNQFTNWDDDLYVIKNTLLPGPDWKGIFTQSVVSNYHPLTMISLALNYYLSGLSPFSYILFNLLLHLANTALVFYFIWIISEKKIWVAGITALIFGIHPMHVESVAWISERKDVLYTFFYLISLITYWKFIQTGKWTQYGLCFFLFLLSLLSKPAAVILPLILFLLDFWKGRAYSFKLILEKIPFLLTSLLFGVITLNIQSHDQATVSIETYSIGYRFLFACYAVMAYSTRFIFPFPLSSFHPYPYLNHVNLPLMLSPLFLITLAIVIWIYRRNKLIVFSLGFFLINLLLVLQIISIGLTIISERYTYVPYIGLAFLFGMLLNNYMEISGKVIGWITISIITLYFGITTFERTMIWHDAGSLWSNVISHYPNTPYARTNRAAFYYDSANKPENASKSDSLFKQAAEDCTIALNIDHKLPNGYETRGLTNLRLKHYNAALADGSALINLAPENSRGYLIRGMANLILKQPDKAVDDFTNCIKLEPHNYEALKHRGILLFNQYSKYSEALSDFNQAINIKPEGEVYLDRSRCYYMLGDLSKARADAQASVQIGETIPSDYQKLLGL